MERRDFISKTCGACAGIATMGLLSSLLQGCTSLPVATATVDNKMMRVSLATMMESKVMIVRNKSIDSDILLVKKGDEFKALKMTCTHQIQPLTATASGLYCSSHGSTFDLEGNATREPAVKPLKSYKTEKVNDNEIIIYLQ